MSSLDHSVAARSAAFATTMSPYPASFNNSSWMYGRSLFSLTCIAMLCAITWGWMMRDIWRDRMVDHLLSLAFLFRFMLAILSFTGAMRVLPEVLILALWGEVTGATMAQIQNIKRITDLLALPDVLAWMGILVLIYPYVMLTLKTQQARSIVILDPLSVWPRLIRAVIIIAVVALIASLMSYGKWSLAHHAG